MKIGKTLLEQVTRAGGAEGRAATVGRPYIDSLAHRFTRKVRRRRKIKFPFSREFTAESQRPQRGTQREAYSLRLSQRSLRLRGEVLTSSAVLISCCRITQNGNLFFYGFLSTNPKNGA